MNMNPIQSNCSSPRKTVHVLFSSSRPGVFVHHRNALVPVATAVIYMLALQ